MNRQTIEQAIKDKAVIEFTYLNHSRIAEPHVLGISDDALQILGYQTGGSSSSGGALPEWRRFKLDEITGLRVTTTHFPGRRPFPSGRHSSWDKIILVVDE